jgi:phosphoglycolate phosphatase
MLKAVVYDLDGTLVDSVHDLGDAVNALLGELQRPPLSLAQVGSFVGEGATLLVQRSLVASQPGLERRAAELLPRWLELYGERLLRHTRAYEGVEALLAEPPEARAVLTNKPGSMARRILDGLGLLGRLRAVVGGDEAPRKPGPEGLLRLCAQLGAGPEETLLVGDSRIDLDTGAAAGVPVCAVTWGLGDPAALRAARPAYVCERVDEVAALLCRLRA